MILEDKRGRCHNLLIFMYNNPHTKSNFLKMALKQEKLYPPPKKDLAGCCINLTPPAN